MGVSWPIWPDTPHLMTASLGVGDNYLLPTALEEGETVSTTMMRDWLTDDMAYRPVTSFGRDERCHVSFSSDSIIFSLCFYYASLCFYYASLCFYYAFIMLSLCFYYAFLGTRIIKVSFFGDVTYLRTIFQILGFLCLPAQIMLAKKLASMYPAEHLFLC